MDGAVRDSLAGTWGVWQVLDSILPTGGFAHSLGLEAAVQLGNVSDGISLHRFALSVLLNTASLLLPFVAAACTCPSVERWKTLDATLHAYLSNKVARNASMSQGTALLRIASSVFEEFPLLKEMKVMASSSHDVHIHRHHAPLFGILFGLLQVDSTTAQRAFLFVTLRDLLSAATRLNIVGPIEAAHMQHLLASHAENLLVQYGNRPIEDAHQAVPVIDVVQGVHENLFSRLFRS
ncbi:hypothetical protein KP509_19G079000 [Ceratopteris richardii]|uniref:Urease accessory protein F n=1 Tax=Ceratopteris richardii TaxID=49495 RepID=A0A8T2SNZ2_CERRI|nr:hypothetical protein KP509_19G079000 [Ceratopteris richardii]